MPGRKGKSFFLSFLVPRSIAQSVGYLVFRAARLSPPPPREFVIFQHDRLANGQDRSGGRPVSYSRPTVRLTSMHPFQTVASTTQPRFQGRHREGQAPSARRNVVRSAARDITGLSSFSNIVAGYGFSTHLIV